MSALTPFAFAIIRAIRTGEDLRYLWIALAAFLSLSMAGVVGNANRRRLYDAVVRSTLVFVVATFLAVFAGWLLGVRVGPGSVFVGAAFGFCDAISCGLYVLAEV